MGAFAGPNIVTSGAVLFLDPLNPLSYPGSGATWYDLSGNGNHQTLQNPGSVVYTNGYFATGSNGYGNNASTRRTPEIGTGTATNVTAFTSAGATTYTIPSLWNTPGSSIELIGGGAAGGGGGGASGGGGGAYAKASNVSLTPGNTLYINVGEGGSSTLNGGNSWVNYTANTPPTSITDGALARGGVQSTSSQDPSIGNITYGGGNGRTVTFSPGGGGGGAGGPNGVGGSGASSVSNAGGGGGGAGGGSSAVSGTGGNGPAGSGGGAAGTGPGVQGGDGTNGGGGGGGGYAAGSAWPGGSGSTYTITAWGSGRGPGGGGGGGSSGASGGLYGGGGGWSGAGARGLVVITTRPVKGNPSAGAWIYVTSLGSSRSIVSCTSTTSSNDGWTFGVAATNYLRVTLNGAAPVNFISTTAAISANTWQYVGVVANGSTLIFYINGIPYDSISMDTHNMGGTAGSITVGNGPDNSYLNGQLSMVTVYDRALSSTEITQNFNAYRGRYGL